MKTEKGLSRMKQRPPDMTGSGGQSGALEYPRVRGVPGQALHCTDEETGAGPGQGNLSGSHLYQVSPRGAEGPTGPGVLGEDSWGRVGRERNGPGRDPQVCHSTSGCPCSPATRSPDGFT